MEMTRIWIVLVTLSCWFASGLLVAQARPLNSAGLRPTEFTAGLDWLQDEAHRADDVDDFGVGEGRVDEIIAAAEQSKRVSALLKTVRETAYSQLDEIDRLKLSINKIICESMEEGCEHMEDTEETSAEGSVETFANLKPEEYVKVYDE